MEVLHLRVSPYKQLQSVNHWFRLQLCFEVKDENVRCAEMIKSWIVNTAQLGIASDLYDNKGLLKKKNNAGDTLDDNQDFIKF